MSLGFQHLYVEVDDLTILKRLIEIYLNPRAGESPKEIGILIVYPEAGEKPKLPWAMREQPEVFPIMLLSSGHVTKDISAWHDASKDDGWLELEAKPTYILGSKASYSALSQLDRQLEHYLALHAEQWERSFRARVPRPDCDGSLEVGYSLSAGYFGGPLVIGLVWAEYHK